MRNYTRTLTCQQCGQEYEPKNHKQLKYCSTKCCIKANTKSNPITEINLTCGHCGVSIDVPKSHKKYCSLECKNKATNYRRRVVENKLILRSDLKKVRDNRIITAFWEFSAPSSVWLAEAFGINSTLINDALKNWNK